MLRSSPAGFSTCVEGEPPQRVIGVDTLLMWLTHTAGTACKPVLGSLLRAIAWHIERSGIWERASGDALVDAPVPQGLKRSRRLDPELRRSMAEAVGQQVAGRTSLKLSVAFNRFRQFHRIAVSARQVDRGLWDRLFAYLQLGRTTFTPARTQIVGLVGDGTRVDKHDYNFYALYSPSLDIAMWCPPTVRMNTFSRCRFFFFALWPCRFGAFGLCRFFVFSFFVCCCSFLFVLVRFCSFLFVFVRLRFASNLFSAPKSVIFDVSLAGLQRLAPDALGRWREGGGRRHRELVDPAGRILCAGPPSQEADRPPRSATAQQSSEKGCAGEEGVFCKPPLR